MEIILFPETVQFSSTTVVYILMRTRLIMYSVRFFFCQMNVVTLSHRVEPYCISYIIIISLYHCIIDIKFYGNVDFRFRHVCIYIYIKHYYYCDCFYFFNTFTDYYCKLQKQRSFERRLFKLYSDPFRLLCWKCH